MEETRIDKTFSSNADNILLTHFNEFFDELQLLGMQIDEMDEEDIVAKIEDLQDNFLDVVAVVRDVLKDNDINLNTLEREME